MKKKKTSAKKPEKEIILRFEEEPVDLDQIVEEVIDMYPQELLAYKAGVRSSIDKLVSETMKKSGGKADPQKIRNIIISKL